MAPRLSPRSSIRHAWIVTAVAERFDAGKPNRAFAPAARRVRRTTLRKVPQGCQDEELPYDNSSSSALPSFMSTVSKPSTNHS
jgi:hypothetical protein